MDEVKIKHIDAGALTGTIFDIYFDIYGELREPAWFWK